MKRIALAVALAALAGSALAADKTYQVTGPVVDVGPESITVQKGKENWQIAKTADTKGGAEVKKGDKVTVQYKMTATSIESKAEKGTKKAKK
jgi:opacity protein-like surface antigen